ncbi:MAG: nickel pincer cofactor biosynthesis protein LarC, partial [bacterium]
MTGKRILFIDPFSGISGDMLLAALISLGAPLEDVTAAVETVIPGEVRIEPVQVTRSGLAGLECRVEVVGGPGRRTLGQMLELLHRSALPEGVKEAAVRTLGSLGRAEGAAHGRPEGPVHLHELGGQDTLADVVGVLTCVAHFAPDLVQCGSVNLGRGYVSTSHGEMPVPAPATAFLVQGMPVHVRGPEAELTTPTGAALAAELAGAFGPMPSMTVHGVGTGAGGRDHEGHPNLLRVFLGKTDRAGGPETAVMIECGIDDVSPEYLAPAVEALQAAGAREVHLIPAFTKKGRVGVLLRVLAPRMEARDLMDEILEVTGSAGIRSWNVERLVQPRQTLTVTTALGPVSVKRWRSPSGRWRFKPEFEECRRLAEREGI